MSCVRQISSSTAGWMKYGLPNRNDGPKPIPVSAARLDAARRARPRLARIREVRLVQHPRRDRREPVQVAHLDARRVAFDAVRRRAVGRDVERLVFLAGVIEGPGRRHVIGGVGDDVELAERGHRGDRMLDRQPLVLAKTCLEEVQQRRALAVAVGVDQRLVLRKRGRGDRARRRAKLATQVGTLEVAGNPLGGHEIERACHGGSGRQSCRRTVRDGTPRAGCRRTGLPSAPPAAGSGTGCRAGRWCPTW